MQSGASTVSTPITGDYAVHKNAYLGDVDGNGIYTGFDAALIARVVVGIDSTGGAVGALTPPVGPTRVIVGDADGDGKLTGADAALVAQKSVQLPTPQIPNLPGIPLVPNGGGSLALDDLAPKPPAPGQLESPARGRRDGGIVAASHGTADGIDFQRATHLDPAAHLAPVSRGPAHRPPRHRGPRRRVDAGHRRAGSTDRLQRNPIGRRVVHSLRSD